MMQEINEEERAALRKATQARDDALRNAERTLEEKLTALHYDWREFLVQRITSRGCIFFIFFGNLKKYL